MWEKHLEGVQSCLLFDFPTEAMGIWKQDWPHGRDGGQTALLASSTLLRQKNEELKEVLWETDLGWEFGFRRGRTALAAESAPGCLYAFPCLLHLNLPLKCLCPLSRSGGGETQEARQPADSAKWDQERKSRMELPSQYFLLCNSHSTSYGWPVERLHGMCFWKLLHEIWNCAVGCSCLIFFFIRLKA